MWQKVKWKIETFFTTKKSGRLWVHFFALTFVFLFLQPNVPVEANINCTVKGDAVEMYKVMLRAMVVSEETQEQNSTAIQTN